MSVLGNLIVKIIGDNKELTATLTDTEKKLQKQTKTFTQMADKMSAASKKMTTFVTLPILGIGTAAVKMAMDAVESENLFEVSMGKMAKSARDWSIELSRSLGLNEYEIRKQVGTFSVMLDSMGLGEQAAYDMAKGLTQLTYDMASFYNLNPEEAFQKLQSGISGEIEPLKRLGIVVNETTVQTYAYTHGIAEQGEKLTEQEKILARYGAIMEQTSKAQGDMARTIESPSNQLRILQSELKETAISFGIVLLPMVQKAMDTIKPYVERLRDLSEEKKKLIVNIGLVVAALGPAIYMISGMIKVVVGLEKAMAKLSVITKLTNIELLAIAGFIINASSAGYGLYKTINDLKNGTIDLKDGLIQLAYPMTVVLGKMFGVKTATEKATEATKENLTEQERGKQLIEGQTQALVEQGYTQEKAAELAMQSAQSMGYFADETEEATEVTNNLNNSVENLLTSLFELYNLNQSVVEATWDYEDAQKKLNEAIAKYGADSREAQEATFGLQDARENLIEAAWREYSAEGTSIERKKELKDTIIGLGQEAVISGEISMQAYSDMLNQFNDTSDGIQNDINNGIIPAYGNFVAESSGASEKIIEQTQGMGLEFFKLRMEMLDVHNTEVKPKVDVDISNVSKKVAEAKSLLDTIKDKTVSIITKFFRIEGKEGLLLAQGGSYVSGFSGGIPAILHPPEVVLNPKQALNLVWNMANTKATGTGQNINNNFYISELAVREEADVNKIANQLYNLQKTALIGAGVR